MLIPVAREAFLPFLVASFFCGIVFGAIYEVFRIRRIAVRLPHRKRKNGNVSHRIDTVLVSVEDVLFSVFAAITLILVSFKLYYGMPRWYSVGAAMLGFGVWRLTAGRLILHFAEAIIALIDRAVSFVGRRLLRPAIDAVRKGLLALQKTLRRRRERSYTKTCEDRMLATVRAELRQADVTSDPP